MIDALSIEPPRASTPLMASNVRAVSNVKSTSPVFASLTGKPLVLKIGRAATLELFVYPDSNGRIADAKKLDRTHLVSATAQQTIERERTLIESSNVIGLLTSLNSHQRERVSDAITAGPPQPDKPQLVKP